MFKNIFTPIAAFTVSIAFFASCNNDSEKTNETTTTDSIVQKEQTPPVEKGVMVGGANMVPSKDIVANASNSADHTTLVAAVAAADLVGTLQGAGPFTVFAPTNAAFSALPAGTVETLLKPENKAKLANILTYHVIAGKFTASELKDGQKLKTVQGEELVVHYKANQWMLEDAKGGMANITIADVISSNGVTFVIDKVLMPKK